MFDHVTVRVANRGLSERFYSTVLGAFCVRATAIGPEFAEWDDFSLAEASVECPRTAGLHLGFAAPSRARVDAFWEAGVAAGYADDGAPGPRPQYGEDYYGAFLLDPDGNSVEAVHHGGMRAAGNLDHLWIRVANLAASKRFYATIAPHAGLERGDTGPERVQFRGARGSLSLVAGEPRTEHVHLAFPAPDDATVAAFHAAAVAAGYADDGLPGERPEYHPGYFAAFVLDPDGHRVEVVDHHR